MLALAGAAAISACSGELPLASPEPSQAAPAAVSLPKHQAAAAPLRAASPKPVGPFAVTAVLAPDREMRAGDYVWDDEAPSAGPLRVVVDIEAQRLFVYRGGQEIGRSSIIYGDDDKPTPFGTFPILEKDADHVSNLYDADMPYMLRLTWDGIAIHGSDVDDWAATNGCIGVPEEFAALLFAQAKLGDQVLVTKGWMPHLYQV